MKSTSIILLISLSVAVLALAYPAGAKSVGTSSAEDDFQVVKVADGVYAAIAKPGG